MAHVRRRFSESLLHLFNFFPSITATSQKSYSEAVKSDMAKCRKDLEASMLWYSATELSEDKNTLKDVSKNNGRN